MILFTYACIYINEGKYDRWHQLAVDEKRTSYRKVENKLYRGSTTH